jgi:hypothetical protein
MAYINNKIGYAKSIFVQRHKSTLKGFTVTDLLQNALPVRELVKTDKFGRNDECSGSLS